MHRGKVVAVSLALLVVAAVAPGAVARPRPFPVATTAIGHLQEIVDRSPAPEYRRYGSFGIRHVALYSTNVLRQAGFATVELHTPADRWWVDYSPGHEPSVRRVADGRAFPTESAFGMAAVTGDAGIECVVRPYAEVGPGECGFVPFSLTSPEWNNLSADVPGALQTIVDRGGAGALLQADVERGALIAHRTRQPLAVVSVVAEESDLVGQAVRLRVQGGPRPARSYDVVGVRRPLDPARGYVLVLAHADGWFAAAADNGGGTAAALAAAQSLGVAPPSGAGVLVALVDGEEVGYIGSTGLVERLRAGLDPLDGGTAIHLGDVEAVVNLDAVSARASDLGLPEPISYRVLVHTDDAAALAGVGAFTAAGVLGLPVEASLAQRFNGGLARTDAGLFAAEGIPVVWPVAGYPEYHTSVDTMATVDPADLAAVATGAASAVRLLGS